MTIELTSHLQNHLVSVASGFAIGMGIGLMFSPYPPASLVFTGASVIMAFIFKPYLPPEQPERRADLFYHRV